MEIEDFSHALCELNTAIQKYLKSKKAIELMRVNRQSICLPVEVENFVGDVLDEKMRSYEKQIIELATKLTQKKADS